MYATETQLLDLFGDTEMALLAAPEDAAVDGVLLRLTVEGGDRSAYSAGDIALADKAALRLTSAIADADRQINSYLSPRYTLPLGAALVDDSPLPSTSADLARHKLMDNRATEEVENRKNDAIRWLRDVSMNKASLGEQDTAVASQQGRMVARQGVSAYDWDGF